MRYNRKLRKLMKLFSQRATAAAQFYLATNDIKELEKSLFQIEDNLFNIRITLLVERARPDSDDRISKYGEID